MQFPTSTLKNLIPFVNVRDVETFGEVLVSLLSQTDDNWHLPGSKIPADWEWKFSPCFTHCNPQRRWKGYKKSIGERLGRGREQRRGEPLGLDKRQNDKTHAFTQVGRGWLTVNINMIITMRGFVVSHWCGACALRGPEKGNLTFQRYVIIDTKRQ